MITNILASKSIANLFNLHYIIGELIALSSVRTRMIHSTRDLYYIFQNLYKDIYCHTDILKPYSEAYDYAEEAIFFFMPFSR